MNTPVNNTDTPPRPADAGPVTPLNARGVFWYSLANLGIGSFYAFNNFVLPLWLAPFTGNAILLSLLGGSHSFEGAFIQPVVGSISDRLRGPGGRRRPFLRIFIPLCSLFLLLTPLGAALPLFFRLPAIVAGVFLFTLTCNVALDPYQALLADITTPAQRGRVTGTWYFVGAAGQVLILLLLAVLLVLPRLHLSLGLGFPLVAALLLGTAWLTCARTPEPAVVPAGESARGHRDDVRLALAGLRTLHQARLYMAMFFLFGAGVGAVTPLLTTFIKQVTGCGNAVALALSALLLVMTGVGSLAFGRLADRAGYKRLLGGSLMLVALASVGALGIHTVGQVALVMGVAGLGIGAQNASAYPLLTRLVPAREIGFYVGLQTSAAALAGPGAGLVTGLLVNHGGHNYRIIFAVCAACLLGSLAVLSRLRESDAPGEVAAREREVGG